MSEQMQGVTDVGSSGAMPTLTHSTQVNSAASAPPESRTAAATRKRTIHGLYSEQPLVPGEDPAEWADFRRRYVAALKPVGMAEEEAAEEIVLLKW